MERLKKARRPFRTQLTRLQNEAETLLAADDIDHDALSGKLRTMETVHEQLLDYDQKILDQMLDDNVEDAEQDAEMTALLQYREAFSVMKNKINSKLTAGANPGTSGNDAASIVTSAAGVKERNFKLPQVTLKKFGGNYEQWLGWWAQFSNIHEDDTIHDADKFQYLMSSMEPGSDAAEVVEGYAQMVDGYKDAVKTLEELYGNPDLLLQVYVRALLTLVISNASAKDKMPLASLHLKLDSHLRSLSTLNLKDADPATWLFPLVESCLGRDTLQAWQRSSLSKEDGSKRNPPKTKLDLLMEFIKQEVRGEQQIQLAQKGFQSCTGEQKKAGTKHRRKDDVPDNEPPATAAGLYTGESAKCVFCDKPGHDADRCFTATAMSYEVRKEKLREKKACFRCFRLNHASNKCKMAVKCVLCGGKHFTLICEKLATSSKPKSSKKKEDAKPEERSEPENTNASSNVCSGRVLLNTTRVNVFGESFGALTARVVGDTGSQRSYIKTCLRKNGKFKKLGAEYLQTVAFGGGKSKPANYDKFEVSIQSLDNAVGKTLHLLQKDQITGDLPGLPEGPWIEKLKQKGISLNDQVGGYCDADILIGLDYWESILTGRREILGDGFVATETIFGWMVGGPVPERFSSATAITSVLVASTDINFLFDMETIGIRDPGESKKDAELEEDAQQHFSETVARGDDGRYIVALPWKSTPESLPTYRNVAERRLRRETTRLQSANKWSDYDRVFMNWEQEGIIAIINDNNVGCFSPHRPVFKDSPTTPVRPVFDASCKSSRQPSLNDLLHKGPNYLETTPLHFLRLRERNIGVTADIRKAFQMLEVREEDRKYQQFLWWEDHKCEKVKVYQHNRVVFGMSSSPFLLGATIDHHLRNEKEDVECAALLRNACYVDNLILSVDSMEDYQDLKERATNLMKKAQMDLRQWWCSSTGELGCSVNEEDRCQPVLGMIWDRREDTISCLIKELEEIDSLTKRKITSVVAKVFDPIGFTCPAMLPPKLLLQECWNTKCSWDDALPHDVEKRFRKWYQDLSTLREIKIPRQYRLSQPIRQEVFVFCDASSLAYGCCVFLRCEYADRVSVQLLMAKSRMAPAKKKMSIPRLELVACLIAARVGKLIQSDRALKNLTYWYYSDSMTALAWIFRNGGWGVFVDNRVKEILQLTSVSQWRHVPGVYNPADLPSRGCTPSQLLESKWWEGPAWMKMSRENFPVSVEEVDEEAVRTELKKTTVNIAIQFKEPMFSSYRKNVAVMGWVLRFINLRVKKVKPQSPYLSVAELRKAELVLIRQAQKECFPNGEVGKGIQVREDVNGVFRVITKLTYRQDTDNFKAPIVMPKDHPMTDLLIREFHRYFGHVGSSFLRAKLREKYWILQSRRCIERVLRKCATCRRYLSKHVNVAPAPLPEKRVQDCEVFETTGVDLAGPLFIKDGQKAWLVLFTCAVFRCVYLDVVCSLSTEAFLGALERFIAIHGRPNSVYSDNGTNFVGTVNLFKSLDWEKVEKESATRQIQWIFNPPSAAWWGGWWERLFRDIKDLLRKNLGRSKLSYDELRTCVAGVSAVMNDRPLTAISDNDDDLMVLTPGMFIRRGAGHFDETTQAVNLKSSYRRMKALLAQLQNRFRKDYLARLVQAGKEKGGRKLAVGDVVLVGADNKKRFDWPLGKIVELMPGRDGEVRVARVKTQSGVLTRPLQRIYPLEVSSEEAVPTVKVVKKPSESKETKVVKPVMISKKGRIIKRPSRYGQCLSFVINC